MFGPGADRKATTELENFCLKVDPFSVWWRPALLLLTLVCAVAAAAWAHWTIAPRTAQLKDYIDYVAPILAFSGLLASWLEWRLSKHEASLDKFYDRLDLANDYRSKLTHQDQAVSALDMYVFVELDNLEYVVERYRMGYIAPRNALRAVRTFQSRLGLSWFKTAARHWACEADNVGYSAETCALVGKLIGAQATGPQGLPPGARPAQVGSGGEAG
ncbi:MAG: hypothetical protein JWO83_3639 [Caulobacteraceae bacterium]|nr:hypothetical protein [Caulobacteraceae bacterium]